MTSPQPLRVGLLLDSLELRSWVVRVIREVEESPYAEIVLVVLNTAPAQKIGRLRRLWLRREYLLYAAYRRLDRRLFRLQPDAFEAVDASPLLEGKPVLEVDPLRKRYSDYFRPDGLERIHSFDLDLALRFGFRILRGKALEIARHGVWSFHHGDIRDFRGGPPGFWEVMTGAPVTGSVLQRLTEELDAGEILYRSYAPTHRRSVERNNEHLYWKSAAFVGRTLRRLAEEGPEAIEPLHDPRPPGPLNRKPSNLAVLPVLTRFALRAGTEKVAEMATRSQWLLGYRLSDEERPGPEAAAGLRPIFPPRDRYWADPFPLRVGGRTFVFVEEYLYRRKRGRVAVLEIDDGGRVSPLGTVLETTHHLSYPFVFQWRGEVFVIPESSAARTVDLYRCRSFPGEWTHEARLFEDLYAVDATLWQEDSRWWLFMNLAEKGAVHARDELCLFHSESPLGPWRPHRRNPVVSDVRCARPAGRLFRWQGDLYRPAQDCSRRYGYAIVFQKVLELSPSVYREETVARIEPDWRSGLLATHTYNREGRLTVVDGMRRVVKGVTVGSRPFRPRDSH